MFAPEVIAMKVSCLVTESEGVALLRINLFKKLKMTPEIRSPKLRFYLKVEGEKDSPVLPFTGLRV